MAKLDMDGGIGSEPGPNLGAFAGINEEWRQGWPFGLTAFIGLGLGGSIVPYIFSVFILPLNESFGWGRGDISLALTCSVAGSLSAPLVGRLIDRYGPRWPLLISWLILAASYVGLAAMPGSIWVFYLLFVILGPASLASTGLGFAKVICSNFIKSRGFSLAVARCGIGFSAIVLPPMLYVIIADTSWRGGYLTMAALICGIAIPLTWAVVGGERGDGVEPAPPSRKDSQRKRSPRDLLLDRHIILIMIGSGLAYASIIAVSSHAIPILTDRHVSGGASAILISLLGAAGLIGGIATGFALDRFPTPAVAFTLLACGAMGALVLALSAGNVPLIAAGLMLVGLSLGAEADILPFVVARYCGVRDYSSVYGIVIIAVSLSAGIGPVAMGYVFDASGSYTYPLYGCSALFLAAAVTYIFLGLLPDSAES